MNKTEFSKPDYTSTKNYHRLEESPKSSSISNTTVKSANLTGPSSSSPESTSLKRSMLPSARKYSPQPPGGVKSSRDSLNSSESNQSTSSNTRSSPVHIKSDSTLSSAQHHHQPSSYHHNHSRTPPKYMPLSPQEKSLMVARQLNSQRQQHLQLQQQHQMKAASPSGSSTAASSPTASLPPKPVDSKNTRRSGSLTRGENRYRIQF